MRISLVLIFLISVLFVNSQTILFPFFQNIKGEKKVFADTAIVKVAPSTGAAFADTLFIGEAINILMQVPFSEVRNNIPSPWYKVTYKKKGYTKVGFISGIDIAIGSLKLKSNNEVLFGLLRNERKDSFINNELQSKDNFIAAMQIVKAGKKNNSVEFKIPPYNVYLDSITSMLLTKPKLRHSNGVIQLELTSTKHNSTFIQYHFIVCSNYQLALLTETIPVDRPVKRITTKYVYDKNKIYYRMSGFEDGDKDMDVYELNNCTIKKVE